MFKTNRLIRGELNKILMRPILYIVSILLVVAIIFSFTRFDISNKTDNYYTISGNTKAEVYANFYSNTLENSKLKIDEMLSNAESTLDYYIELNKTDKDGNISPLRTTFDLNIDTIINLYETNYQNAILDNSIASCNYYKSQIQFDLEEVRKKYNNAIDQKNSSILITTKDANELITLIDQSLQKLKDNKVNYNKIDTHLSTFQYLFSSDRMSKINNILHSIQDVLIDDQTITTTKKLITTAKNNLSIREQIITECYNDSSTKISQLKNLILDYYMYADQIALNIDTTIIYTPIKHYSDTYIHSLKGDNYSNLYNYQLQETLTSTQYIINNNLSHNDYATMYNIGMSSTAEPNAFDFVYNGMELCSFIIIIFCVVIGAGMVAGEQSNGTLKLLAIRPYKRHKILSSKILSTLLFGTILSLFCMLILFILGWINFGIDFTPVMMIFNSTTALTIHPLLVMLLYLGTLIFKILAYVLIAVAISVLFRSNVGAVSISIFIFFFSTLFGYMFVDSVWYAYLPFSNFDLFKYFGGNFITGTSTSTLSSTAILYNTNFFFSIIISAITIIVLAILTYRVFNKREIK